MRMNLLVARLCTALLCCCGMVAAQAEKIADKSSDKADRQKENLDARAWLERMSLALVQQNYDGRFIHSTPVQSETMRIVHRNLKGRITERLVSLDGSGREYLRTNTEVTYYMPDKRSVLVEKRPDSEGLLTLIPEYKPGMEAYYDITTGPTMKVLERRAQLLTVQPRDEYRYGYRLWLDTESAMPLKSQLFDRQGRVIEQVAFAELAVRDRIADQELQPTLDTNGFEWVRQEVRSRNVPVGEVGWRVQNLPPGFKLKLTRLQPVNDADHPVRHLVFSDGLATVSMFIEPLVVNNPPSAGLQRVGSSHAFQSDTHGFQVTAVGEVPAITVRRMVSSLTRDPAP